MPVRLADAPVRSVPVPKEEADNATNAQATRAAMGSNAAMTNNVARMSHAAKDHEPRGNEAITNVHRVALRRAGVNLAGMKPAATRDNVATPNVRGCKPGRFWSSRF